MKMKKERQTPEEYLEELKQKKEKLKKYHIQYYIKHKKERLLYQQAYRKIKGCTIRKPYIGKTETKKVVLKYYGNGQLECTRCSESRIQCLTLDVIEFGSKSRKIMPRPKGHTFYAYLRNHNYPDGYETICMNCLMIKWSNIYGLDKEEPVKELYE